MDANLSWTRYADHCPLSRDAILKIAEVLSIPAKKRDAAAPEIEEVFGVFNHPNSGDIDYYSPQRLAKQSAAIFEAAANLVSVISDAHERTLMDFNITCWQFFPGDDYADVARRLEAIARRVVDVHKKLKNSADLRAPKQNKRGAPKLPKLGTEGLPAYAWFIKDMAQLAHKYDGQFPANKNEGFGKWKQLHELIKPGLPKGFFKGITDHRRYEIVKQAVRRGKKWGPPPRNYVRDAKQMIRHLPEHHKRSGNHKCLNKFFASALFPKSSA
jgi:hypothetical protein